MHIALATDRHFVEMAGVLLRSICARGNLPDAKLVLFCDGLTPLDKKDIQACADRHVYFIDVDDAAKQRLDGLKATYNWPKTAFVRLLAPDLVAGDGRLLYLDSDIVVNGDLRPLANIDLGGKPLAAYSRYGDFFNSGVLMIDLEKWREERITARTLAWAKEKGEALQSPDQDSLNAVIGTNYLRLDRHWNLTQRQAADFASVAIIHFTGMKPDHAECENPARGVYLEHRANTPWAGKPLKSSFSRRLRRFKQSVGKKLGVAL